MKWSRTLRTSEPCHPVERAGIIPLPELCWAYLRTLGGGDNLSHVRLRCSGCESEADAALGLLACAGCGEPLDLAYVDSKTDAQEEPEDIDRLPGVWPLWERLPLHRQGDIVSMGEGSTPCVPLERVGARLGLERLYAKVEYTNPTGSFKDRGTAVMLSVAKELGFSRVVDDSSGNAGASLAAYAARAGMQAIIFAPASAPPNKLDQIRFYGAELRLVEGSREAVAAAARKYTDESGSFYASHNWSAYFLDGMKSFAYEAAVQLPEGIDHMVVPVGNGSLLLGPWRGFSELVEDSSMGRMPRLHCVQASACMPTVAAWKGDDWTPDQARPTVAGGVAVAAPPRGRQVVDAIRQTDGVAVAVEEESIVEWHKVLAAQEGLFIEPTSATAFAGLGALVAQGAVQARDTILVPITGFGLKDRLPGG